MRNYSININQGLFDFKAYYDIVAQNIPNDCRIVECGVANGASAMYLCEAILNRGKNIEKFYWVDSMAYGGYNQMKVIYENIIKSDLGNYIEVIPQDSVKASKLFNGNSLDFVFLDSSHEYRSTLKEIRAWYGTLKDDAILAGHDYYSTENPGVRKAVDALLPETIKRETIDTPVHFQEFNEEQFLHTLDTERKLGIWYIQKRFYFQP